MKSFNNIITLNKNTRGVYDLDTIKGCSEGLRYNLKGCYNNCYAAAFAKQYGYDFSKSVKRYFKNKEHINAIIRKINTADTSFIRIGNSGDPSEDWAHTVNICKLISKVNKPIVIITKHWRAIPEYLLKDIEKLNVCINTSISALDKDKYLNNRLCQFYRLKNACNSVLRINSCNFNVNNWEGLRLHVIQKGLFKYKKNIDNILRFRLNNTLVIKGIVKVDKVKFLRSNVYASIFNKNTYFGPCSSCPDLCGVGLEV